MSKVHTDIVTICLSCEPSIKNDYFTLNFKCFVNKYEINECCVCCRCVEDFRDGMVMVEHLGFSRNIPFDVNLI